MYATRFPAKIYFVHSQRLACVPENSYRPANVFPFCRCRQGSIPSKFNAARGQTRERCSAPAEKSGGECERNKRVVPSFPLKARRMRAGAVGRRRGRTANAFQDCTGGLEGRGRSPAGFQRLKHAMRAGCATFPSMKCCPVKFRPRRDSATQGAEAKRRYSREQPRAKKRVAESLRIQPFRAAPIPGASLNS